MSASSRTRNAIDRRTHTPLARTGLLLAGALCMLYPLGAFAHSSARGLFLENDVVAASGGEASELFGMGTEPVGIGALSERWHHVMDVIAQDSAAVARCRSNGRCAVAAQRLIDISAEGIGRSGRARVGLINRATNLAISSVSDERQWGVVDHWSDPFETLLSYRGDCEDYAIVKYTALLEAGVPTDDVKIVILKDFFPNEYHAVATVRVNGEWLILDNRTLTLVRDRDLTRSTPVFVLDQEGVRRFNQAARE